MPSAEGDFSHLHPLPAARPGCPVLSVVEGWHSEDSLNYPIQSVVSKDGTTWELIWVWGILVHPSLPSSSLSSTNLLYKEDFLRSVRRRLDLSSDGVDDGTHRLDVLGLKLSRTYPGEKPLSLSVLTHGCCLTTRKPTWHLLAMPNTLMRKGARYEGGWSTSFHLLRNYDTFFKPRFF